jgi:tetratricopeptide (TPR) repeat protein
LGVDETSGEADRQARLWNDRAIDLARQRRYDEALLAFVEAEKLAPADPAIRANLGHLLLSTGCVAEALGIYESVLAADPDSAQAQFNYAAALRAGGRDRAAIRHYRMAITLRPDYVEAHNNLAAALTALGQLDEAAAVLRRAIALAPGRPRLYGNLAHLAPLDADDPAVAVLERLAIAPEGLSEDDRIHLHFALGKVQADLGRQASAMAHLERGNALHRRRIDYDEAATLALFDRIAASFPVSSFENPKPTGVPSPVPIFVVGMPRSGTSLVEQILASHPRVAGAGELQAIPDVVAALGGAYPEGLPTLAQADGLHGIALTYLDRLRDLAPSAERVVDKMPGNFLHLGLIHLALPGARILHVRRDPIETCASCFMTRFAHGQDYSYDLAELGRYWRAYDRLMDHWRRVLPAGTMLEVEYERIVVDFDMEVRRMLDFCGLEWHDACRDFHRTARPVHTASAAQVRRPLYRKPAGQWAAYRGRLGFP